jgi:hypothetical protein
VTFHYQPGGFIAELRRIRLVFSRQLLINS